MKLVLVLNLKIKDEKKLENFCEFSVFSQFQSILKDFIFSTYSSKIEIFPVSGFNTFLVNLYLLSVIETILESFGGCN